MFSTSSPSASSNRKRKYPASIDCPGVSAKRRRPLEELVPTSWNFSGSKPSLLRFELDSQSDYGINSRDTLRNGIVRENFAPVLESDDNKDSSPDGYDSESSAPMISSDFDSDNLNLRPSHRKVKDKLQDDLEHVFEQLSRSNSPETDKEHLRSVLDGWSNSTYRHPSGEVRDWTVHLFYGHYSNNDIEKGASCLTFPDSQRIQRIQGVVETSGYMILLGNVQFEVTGYGVEEDIYRWRRIKYKRDRTCQNCHRIKDEDRDYLYDLFGNRRWSYVRSEEYCECEWSEGDSISGETDDEDDDDDDNVPSYE